MGSISLKIASDSEFGLFHGAPIKERALGRIMTLDYTTLIGVKLAKLTPGNWES
jgi:hypothetical protein